MRYLIATLILCFSLVAQADTFVRLAPNASEGSTINWVSHHKTDRFVLVAPFDNALREYAILVDLGIPPIKAGSVKVVCEFDAQYDVVTPGEVVTCKTNGNIWISATGNQKASGSIGIINGSI